MDDIYKIIFLWCDLKTAARLLQTSKSVRNSISIYTICAKLFQSYENRHIYLETLLKYTIQFDHAPTLSKVNPATFTRSKKKYYLEESAKKGSIACFLILIELPGIKRPWLTYCLEAAIILKRTAIQAILLDRNVPVNSYFTRYNLC